MEKKQSEHAGSAYLDPITPEVHDYIADDGSSRSEYTSVVIFYKSF